MTDVENKFAIDAVSVKTCWSKIKSGKGVDAFVDDFFQFIFEQHPDMRALFPDSLTEQKSKLFETLNSVINGIEFNKELQHGLIKLGEHHKKIGIKAEAYDHFIDAIVAVANSSSNFTLSDKELSAWKNAFRMFSDIMLKAY